MDNEEIRDILVSVLVISLAFTIADFGGLLSFFAGRRPDAPTFALLFAVSVVTVGIGFVLHELAHKYTAMHYGARASYRSWTLGLQIALLSSLFGFIFAAPGATYIFSPYISRRQNGIISAIGPLTNIALAGAFLFLGAFALVALPSAAWIIGIIMAQGVMINLWLALFNMLPIPPLDGSKVLAWNPIVWGAVGAAALLPLLALGIL